MHLLKSPVSVHAPGGLDEKKGTPFQKGIQCPAVYPRAAAAHLKNVDLEPRDSTGKALRLEGGNPVGQRGLRPTGNFKDSKEELTPVCY